MDFLQRKTLGPVSFPANKHSHTLVVNMSSKPISPRAPMPAVKTPVAEKQLPLFKDKE